MGILLEDGEAQLMYVIAVMISYGFATYCLKPWRHFLNNTFDMTMSVMLIAAASAMLRFAANPAEEASRQNVDRTVAWYTQCTNFLPLAVAMVSGANMVWLHFHPEIQDKKDEKLANDLERVAIAFTTSIHGGHRVKSGIRILSEMDKHCLSQAMNILLAESQMRIFNLRKSLDLQAAPRQGSSLKLL